MKPSVYIPRATPGDFEPVAADILTDPADIAIVMTVLEHLAHLPCPSTARPRTTRR
jgi:hypothetical protein